MRLLRLPVLVLAVLVGAGVVGCSTTIEGTGTLAEGVITAGPTRTTTGSPTTTSAEPTETSLPTRPPPPPPTTNPISLKRRVLCAVEQAAIASINRRFIQARSRDAQVTVLRSGAVTISGQLARSGLPGSDRIYRYGLAVLTELKLLIRAATSGANPSTNPYNVASKNFQKACSSV